MSHSQSCAVILGMGILFSRKWVLADLECAMVAKDLLTWETKQLGMVTVLVSLQSSRLAQNYDGLTNSGDSPAIFTGGKSCQADNLTEVFLLELFRVNVPFCCLSCACGFPYLRLGNS